MIFILNDFWGVLFDILYFNNNIMDENIIMKKIWDNDNNMIEKE
jgi:hypothetical protein